VCIGGLAYFSVFLLLNLWDLFQGCSNDCQGIGNPGLTMSIVGTFATAIALSSTILFVRTAVRQQCQRQAAANGTGDRIGL
jgi:hypothetical protein